jgi:hypothetical protein
LALSLLSSSSSTKEDEQHTTMPLSRWRPLARAAAHEKQGAISLKRERRQHREEDQTEAEVEEMEQRLGGAREDAAD